MTNQTCVFFQRGKCLAELPADTTPSGLVSAPRVQRRCLGLPWPEGRLRA